MSVTSGKSPLSWTIHHQGFDVAGVYLLPNRPWLSLYGVRLLCSLANSKEQSLIQAKLPEEVMTKLFLRLGPYGLGIASCVCRQWYILAQQPQFWYKACLEAFPKSTRDENIEIVRMHYNSSWKRMFLERPHLRFDGIYVAKNTYLRRGLIEWRERTALHVVPYFRYLRFLPCGRFRYCTTPSTPSNIAGFMVCPMSIVRKRKVHVTLMVGDYEFNDGLAKCSAFYPNLPHIRFCIVVRLRSTTRGAHNRLDIEKITTAEVRDDPELEEEDEDSDMNPELEHQRGLSSFVFVPWEQIDTCSFNQPKEVDYYIA